MNFFFIYLTINILSCEYFGSCIPYLNYYETLHLSKVKDYSIRSKRNVDNLGIRKLNIHVLGRDFNMILKPREGLLNHHFQAVSVNKDGYQQRINFAPEDDLLEGQLDDDPNSFVSAYFEDKALSVIIENDKETYIIEPSWRHLPNSTNYSMIAYRESDILKQEHSNNTNSKKHCGGIVIPPSSAIEIERIESYHDRKRRESAGDAGASNSRTSFDPKYNTCSMLLVADYRFFKEMGGGSKQHTAKYLIQLIDRVDHIYRKTQFTNGEDSFIGFGLEIKDIEIHTEPSVGYNKPTSTDKDVWNIRALLDAFSVRDFSKWCIAHLFTHQQFTEGTLGLAFIGNARGSGGVCSPRYFDHKTQDFQSLNTGWTTSLDNAGFRLVTRQADLVTAHEIGHNWGSLHDPAAPQCVPDSKLGGKYIMYTYSVEGYESNNRLFSPCSTRYIYETVRARNQLCFQRQRSSYCGNLRVEEREACDAGMSGRDDQDPCCNANCQLKPGAACSDVNAPCCTKCQMLGLAAQNSPPRVCFSAVDLGQSCLNDALCQSNNANCPAALPRPDGLACVDGGKCFNGSCRPLCESHGLRSCICDNIDESCLRCCREPSTMNGTCMPFRGRDGSQQTIGVADGRPCARGVCTAGKCQVKQGSLAIQMWDLFSDLTFDKAVKFMRDNVVGTILIISLIFWVPGSAIISYSDHKLRHSTDVEDDVFVSNLKRRCRRRRDRRSITYATPPLDLSKV